jgi:hypothetical protein
MGPQGPTGPRGPDGVGLTSGAVLLLLPGSTPPAGFTKIGAVKLPVVDAVSGKPGTMDLDVYVRQ